MWLKMLLLARECDKGGEILIGGFKPVPEQYAAVCKVNGLHLERVLEHLGNVELITPKGRIANYRKRVDQDRRDYQRERHKLRKTYDSLLGDAQSVHSGQHSGSKVSKKKAYISNNNINNNTFNYTKDYEDKDFGTRFVAWYMHCWGFRKPTVMEQQAGSEFNQTYGWEKLKAAMKRAAKQGQRWWAVEKILNGEWDRPTSKGSNSRVTRHHVDED